MAGAKRVIDNRAAAVVPPVGTAVADDIAAQAADDAEFAHFWDRYAEAREIAWQLIKFRMARGLTQEQLAALAGTSPSHISRLESGQHLPSLSNLKKISAALKIRMSITFTPCDELIAAD